MPACPPGASRSITIVRRRSEALCTAAASPAGPAPTITVSYSAASGSVSSSSSSATRRSCGRTTVLPPTTRIAGRSSSGGSGAAPLLDRVVRVGLEPGEGDLVAVEEAPQVGARSVPAIADDDRPRRRWLRSDARQPARAAHPIARERPDGLDEPRLLGGDRVVVVRLDAHHPRLLRRTESDREHGAERDRHLAEEVAGVALADDARDAVDELDRLDAAFEQGEERTAVALVRRVLARSEADVRGRAREPLPALGAQGGEVRDPLNSSGVTIATRR